MAQPKTDTKVNSHPVLTGVVRGPGHAERDEGQMHFEIPSDLLKGREVQEAILSACKEAGYTEDAFFAIKLALDEAVTNAIKHGNKLDPNKNVIVDALVTPTALWVEVTDEGPGFIRDAVPDPTQEANLEKCSGRGLLLIEAYMTSVTWSEDGKTIRMEKINDTSGPSLP